MADFPPPLSPSHVTGGGSSRNQWRVISAGPHVGPVTLGGGGGGGLGCPLAGFPPTQGNIVFCLVLLNYMTSRLCFFILYSSLDTAVLLVLKVGTNENGSACGRWLSISI